MNKEKLKQVRDKLRNQPIETVAPQVVDLVGLGTLQKCVSSIIELLETDKLLCRSNQEMTAVTVWCRSPYQSSQIVEVCTFFVGTDYTEDKMLDMISQGYDSVSFVQMKDIQFRK